MTGSQKSLKYLFPELTCRPKKDPRGGQGARKVGGSAPHIYIFLIDFALVNADCHSPKQKNIDFHDFGPTETFNPLFDLRNPPFRLGFPQQQPFIMFLRYFGPTLSKRTNEIKV